jgi:CBS domain-containing protein
MGVEEAANWMLATGYRHLPVVDGPDLLGVISIKDVLWAISEPSPV